MKGREAARSPGTLTGRLPSTDVIYTRCYQQVSPGVLAGPTSSPERRPGEWRDQSCPMSTPSPFAFPKVLTLWWADPGGGGDSGSWNTDTGWAGWAEVGLGDWKQPGLATTGWGGDTRRQRVSCLSVPTVSPSCSTATTPTLYNCRRPPRRAKSKHVVLTVEEGGLVSCLERGDTESQGLRTG